MTEVFNVKTKFLMGNEAIAFGAIDAGVGFVSGYPGTPSTEVLETVAKNRPDGVHVEWSVNEKAALECAAGAAYCGVRSLVTMKQVGLNVASDPLMSLSYVGVKGGMVVVVADDPGPISSQTEQDTRTFAQYSKLPVFDPASPEEAYSMIREAFEVSEKYETPVLFRPTTRVCHGCANVEILGTPVTAKYHSDFVKDTMRWVIFPRTSYLNHIKLEKRRPVLGDEFSESKFNRIFGSGKKGVICGGISRAYVLEALEGVAEPCKIFEVGTPYPFPEKLALEFLDGVDEVLCVEELDPVLEKELLCLCGKYALKKKIYGKLDLTTPLAGENSADSVKACLSNFLGFKYAKAEQYDDKPDMPVRPPVLCAGCPHRASFFAVKCAAKGRNAVFCGDIGCYTLGNAMPLDMVDTCLCMGADVTVAQGISVADGNTLCFSFIGDSTFFASGITGVINAVYNKTDIVLIVLDNSTTAMTGHQPHPGTGVTMMGERHEPLLIENILRAVGVTSVCTVDPLKQDEAVSAVKNAISEKGVRAVIFKSPCIAIEKSKGICTVDDEKCIDCKRCVSLLGCPATVIENNCVKIEPTLCTGCMLCSQVCPADAISFKGGKV